MSVEVFLFPALPPRLFYARCVPAVGLPYALKLSTCPEAQWQKWLLPQVTLSAADGWLQEGNVPDELIAEIGALVEQTRDLVLGRIPKQNGATSSQG